MTQPGVCRGKKDMAWCPFRCVGQHPWDSCCEHCGADVHCGCCRSAVIHLRFPNGMTIPMSREAYEEAVAGAEHMRAGWDKLTEGLRDD